MPVGVEDVGLDDHVFVAALGQFGEVGQAQGGDDVVLQLPGIELQQLVEDRTLGIVKGAFQRDSKFSQIKLFKYLSLILWSKSAYYCTKTKLLPK